MKYLRSTILAFKDIVNRNSEFATKTQFLFLEYPFDSSFYSEFRKFAVGKNLVAESDWFNLFQENREKFYTILTQFLFR